MTREEEIKYIFTNKNLILEKKKNAIKRGDCVLNVLKEDTDLGSKTNKSEVLELSAIDADVLRAKLVINTTNVIDSHMDCHIPGLWTKTLSENKMLYLLQEHEMEFDKIISDSINDELIATAEKISWKNLGYDYPGKTEALIFSSQIKKEVNEFMFDLYRKGRVLNHSVGMRYVKLFLCIDSEDAYYAAEKESWDKYYPMVINQEIADEKGFFWAVTEAKVIEGSAVVKGSNQFTPVMEIEIEDNTEAGKSTSEKQEPTEEVTQITKRKIFIN
jgi:hypothetical protein